MKLKYISLFSLLLIGLVSCNKEVIEPEKPEWPKTIRVEFEAKSNSFFNVNFKDDRNKLSYVKNSASILKDNFSYTVDSMMFLTGNLTINNKDTVTFLVKIYDDNVLVRDFDMKGIERVSFQYILTNR